jgi:hypothetical protein
MPTTSQSSLDRLTDVFADMLELETRMVVDLLGTVRDTLQGGSTGQLGHTLQRLVPLRLPHRVSCSCEIPPPCWMPRAAGEVTSFVCGGATASVQIQVSNCGAVARTFTFDATTGGQGPATTFNPPQLTLGPMQRGTVSASVSMPANAADARADVVLWIRGCNVHFVRWCIRTTSRGGTCCHEVEIEDCPDYVHHWYDHFYCQRPCLADQANAGRG